MTSELPNQEFRSVFSANLIALLKKNGLIVGKTPLTEIAGALDMRVTTLQKWLRAESLPEPHRWRGLCDFFKCTLDELFLGTDVSTRSFPGYSEVKILDGVKNGALISRRILIEHGDRRSTFRNHFLFCVTENCMEPLLIPGDYVIIDPRRNKPDTSSIMLIHVCDRLMIRRIQMRVSGEISLIPENPKYQVESLPDLVQCHNLCEPLSANAELRCPEIIGSVVGRVLINR